MVRQNATLTPPMALLRQIGISLRHSLAFPQICKTVVDILRTESGAENCSLYLVESRDPRRLVLRAAMGRQDEMPVFNPDPGTAVAAGNFFELGRGILGRAAREQQAILVADVSNSQDFLVLPSSPVRIKSLLSVPLLADDRLLGGINLSHPEPGQFDLSLLAVMETVADMVSLALHRLQPPVVAGDAEPAAMPALSSVYDEIVEQEKKYRFLVERSPDGMVVVRDGKLIYANPAFLDMVGRREVIGRPLTDFVSAREMNCCQGTGPYLAADGVDRACFEAQLQRDGGKPLAVEVAGCRLRHKNGESFYLYCRDASSREQLDRVKDTFFASLVHELKNPLTVIHSYLQLLAGRAAGFGPQEHKLLGDMQTATRRLMKLLNDIMSYSRLSCLDQPLQLKEWQINDEIISTVKFFTPLLQEKQIAVRLELQPDLEAFPFDREKISQVLVNLLDNAVKFTPRGGTITLTSRQVSSPLREDLPLLGYDADNELSDREGKKFVEISVADTGAGLPADEELVFNEFYTAGNSNGTGLGLPICRRIIHCHQGKITVASSDQGTVFTFFLPVEVDTMAAFSAAGNQT